MKKVVLTSLFLAMSLFANGNMADKSNTDTKKSEKAKKAKNGDLAENGKDKHGNVVYEREITISTPNYQVENFWKKFDFSGNGQKMSSRVNIVTKGRIRTTVEATSLCTLYPELDEDGCSGQKPFLLNNEVLSNPITAGGDEYEVVFIEANDFNNTDKNGFYPLDISRNIKYYEDPAITNPGTSDRGFFGFFTKSFDFIFSKTVGFGSDFFGNPDIADTLETGRSDEAEDRRQRYIANIIAGVDKEDRMKKSVNGSSATSINNTLNTPVSLLHYAEAKKTTKEESCKFMFLSTSSDGIMCRMMSGFGMDAWMPFFNKTKSTEIQSSFIMADTENSLLAMTGEIESVPYMQDVGGNDDDKKLSFLKNMLKPMSTMFNFMSTMMFGSSKSAIVSKPVERVYNFANDEAMTMTFAITNKGTEVNDFMNFKLLKIRSVYGDKINSCKVKKSAGMISWSHWTETFYEGDTNSNHGKTGDEWVDWCQKSTGKKGMFDYLTNWSSGGPFNPINWMKGIFSRFMAMFFGSYSIEEITNSIGRGLILNIKKVDINVSTPLTTPHYQLMQTN